MELDAIIIKKLIEALSDMVSFHCGWSGEIESDGHSANEKAISLLVKLGVLVVLQDADVNNGKPWYEWRRRW